MSDLKAIDTDLTALAEQINAEHDQAQEAMRSSLTHARICGELLLQAKALVNHGQWLPWLAANCAFSDRTARGYMRVAANWPELEKSATVANLTYREALALLAEPRQATQADFDNTFTAAYDDTQARLSELDKRLETADFQECLSIIQEAGNLQNGWAELGLRLKRRLGEVLGAIDQAPSGWPDYEIHELGNLFPMMQPAELQSLAEDIKNGGLIHPIVLYEGKILDGKCRYEACRIAGVKPHFVNYEDNYHPGGPLDFVIKVNMIRAHYSPDQRAVAALKYLEMIEK